MQKNTRFVSAESEYPQQNSWGIFGIPFSKWLVILGSIICAPISVLCASALVEILISVLAIPVSFFVTHDVYLAILASSYGPYSAALILQWLMLAMLIWSFGLPLYVSLPTIAGMPLTGLSSVICAAIAYAILPLVDALLPITRVYTPAFISMPVLVIAGLGAAFVGGLAHTWLFRWYHKSHTIHRVVFVDFWQMICLQGMVSLGLAAVSETTIALLTAMNRM